MAQFPVSTSAAAHVLYNSIFILDYVNSGIIGASCKLHCILYTAAIQFKRRTKPVHLVWAFRCLAIWTSRPINNMVSYSCCEKSAHQT